MNRRRAYQILISFVPHVSSLLAKIYFSKCLEDALNLAKEPLRSLDMIVLVSVQLAFAKAVEHALLAFSDFVQKRQGNYLAAEYQQKILQKSLRTNLDFNRKYPPSTISSLINHDAAKLIDYFYELCNICLIPLHLTFSMDIIKSNVGDFWIPILFLIVGLSYVTFYYSRLQLAESATLKEITQERYRIIQNVNYSIKYIKGQNQEAFYAAKIDEIRGREIACLARHNTYAQKNAFLKKFAQPIIIAAILMYYVVSLEAIDMKGLYQIEQSFWIVQQCLNTFPILLCHFLDSLQNMQRIEDFLATEEISPKTPIIKEEQQNTHNSQAHSRIIVDSTMNAILPRRITLNLSDVKPNKLIVLKGPTASGKSLFFKALLGEYNDSARLLDGNLSEIAYVGQDNWLACKSIRDNIILDCEFNQAYFDLVVSSLDLHKDIADFSLVINQRSDNLSGGQKQRINIARALYQTSKKLILLDDSFCSLDKRVMKTCLANIKKYFLPTRTIILAINESHYIESIADQVIAVSQFGTIQSISFANDLEQEEDDNNNKETSMKSKQKPAKKEDESPPLSSSSLDTLVQQSPTCPTRITISKRTIDSQDIQKLIEDLVSNESTVASPPVSSPPSSLKNIHSKEQKEFAKQIKNAQDNYNNNNTSGKATTITTTTGLFSSNKAKQTLEMFLEYSSMDPAGRKYLYLATASVLAYSILDFVQSQILKNWDDDGMFFSLITQNGKIAILIGVMVLNNLGQNLRKIFVDGFCLTSSKKIHDVVSHETLASHYQLYINQTITPSRIQDILSIQISTLDRQLNNQLPAFYFYFSGIIVSAILSLLGSNDMTMICALCVYMYLGLSIATRNIEEQKDLQKKLKTFSSPLIGYGTQFLQGLAYIRAYGIGEFMLKEFVCLQSKEQYWKQVIKHKKIIHDMKIIALGTAFNVFSFIYTLHSMDPLSIGPKMTKATHIDRYLVLLVRHFNDIQDSMASYSKCADYLKEIRAFNDSNYESAIEMFEKQVDSLNEQKKQKEMQGDDSQLELKKKNNKNITMISQKNGERQHRLKGSIEFINFTAKYNESKIALNNLNLSIPAGEKVCIVGRTGSGKSTLLLSILDLLHFKSGEIRFDNQTGLQGADIREEVSIIMQDSIVFEGSVKQNIDPDNVHSNESLDARIHELGLRDILSQNKLDLELQLEEGGKNLSQGERQVVSLVRALIQHRSLILFDEANSNIDSKNEEILSNFLSKTTATVIFIAHKITNVMSFDRIVYLSEGKILEQGSPANLLADSSSHFYALYNHH